LVEVRLLWGWGEVDDGTMDDRTMDDGFFLALFVKFVFIRVKISKTKKPSRFERAA